MCMQWRAAASLIKTDVLPGYSLYQFTKDTTGWPVGWYAIVEGDDPEFVFRGPVLLDPCAGLTEDDLDVMPEYPEGYDDFKAVAEELSAVGVQFTSPWRTYMFVKACVDSGYDPEKDGYEMGFWLTNHLAEKINEA